MAIESQPQSGSRIEFGQLRDLYQQTTDLQLDLNLQNADQVTIFDSSLLEAPHKAETQTITENKDKIKSKFEDRAVGQLNFKLSGEAGNYDPDQLILHYKEELFEDGLIPYYKSAQNDRRRLNRFPRRR